MLTLPRWLNKTFAILVAMVLFQLSQGIARHVHLAPLLFPAFAGRYLWVRYFEHHLWQMVFALVCIAVLSRGRFSEWGFNLNGAPISRRYLLRFCAVCTVIVLGVVLVPTLLTHEAGPGLIQPTTPQNTIGWMVFEWIFVGISEEILFRGLIQNFLERSFPGVWHVFQIPVPHAGLLTTILFCLGHIPDWLHPHLVIDQQIIAFCLSLYISIIYCRTRSLVGPIFAHDFNDGLFVTVQTICFRLL